MINTLQQVKQHLRLSLVDTTEDNLLVLYMAAAEDDIKNYIDDDIPGPGDSPQEPIPFAIMAAHLLLVGGLYENRESETYQNEIKQNPAVTRLLFPYRRKIGV